MNRIKEEMYRNSTYSSKSRDHADSHKRESYYPKERETPMIKAKQREAAYSPKHQNRGMDRRASYNERRESFSKREYGSHHAKEGYSKREREHSSDGRNTGNYSFKRERGSFSRDGGFVSSRGSRGSHSDRRVYESKFDDPREYHVSMKSGYDQRPQYDSRRGNSFVSRGNSFASGGNSFASGGNIFASRGNSFASRGNSFASRGVNKPFMENRNSYSSRGRGSLYSSRGREDYSSRGVRSMRGMRSPQFLPNLGSRAQFELTRKLVASVLEETGGRKPYEHGRGYPMRRGRGFYPRESDRQHRPSSYNFPSEERPMRPRSRLPHFDQPGPSSRSAHSEVPFAPPPKRIHSLNSRLRYESNELRKRPKIHDNDDDDISTKRQRLSRRTNFKEDSIDHASESDRKSSRSRSDSKGEERRVREKDTKEGRREKTREGVEPAPKSGSSSGATKSLTDGSEKEEEQEEDEEEGNRQGASSPGGVQVTFRANSEGRNVNSRHREGIKSEISERRVYVDLQCPHCPEQKSITFKDYKYHLDSRFHRTKIDNLTYKHSMVLRRIRLQQRTQLREAEDKWEKDQPQIFKQTISRYCNLCKLAFKCPPEDDSSKGIEEHNESKLHKVQQQYLFPQCKMCRMSFPSRMVYEYHIASIRHLRIRTMARENGGVRGSGGDLSPGGVSSRGDNEVDLDNFITMDSVGGEEDLGSEKEEITGKLEDLEKAEEDAKEDEDDEEEEEDEEDLDVEEEGNEIEQEEDAAGEDILGRDYLVPFDGLYCSICYKAIRIDGEGGESLAVEKHCRGKFHLENYHYIISEESMGELEEYSEDGHYEDLEGDDIDGGKNEDDLDHEVQNEDLDVHNEDDLDNEVQNEDLDLHNDDDLDHEVQNEDDLDHEVQNEDDLDHEVQNEDLDLDSKGREEFEVKNKGEEGNSAHEEDRELIGD